MSALQQELATIRRLVETGRMDPDAALRQAKRIDPTSDHVNTLEEGITGPNTQAYLDLVSWLEQAKRGPEPVDEGGGPTQIDPPSFGDAGTALAGLFGER